MKIFISGSISIKKLPKFAIEKIDNIIRKEYLILIGDAKGVDSSVQKYLQEINYKNVIVYYVGNKTRNNHGNWNTNQVRSYNEKGRQLYTLKDIKMANDADYGLMIWDGVSEGTLKNINVMQSKNKKFFVVTKEIVIDDKHLKSLLKTKNLQKDYKNMQVELFQNL